jgi:GTP:adenosylcobinamide-phosphate guanylyltransferase
VTDPSKGATALVLAGQRDGKVDPLCAGAGVAYKAMVPVAGRPMILHVLDALVAAPEIDRIVISINEGAGIQGNAAIAALIARGRVRIEAARANLVDSVVHALANVSFPVLVTTADNVLLTPAAIAELRVGVRRRTADIGVAFAREADVLAAHPTGQRRFYRFADDAYSNCNSYWLAKRDALAPAEVFRSGGQFAKHPARIVGAFGILNLIRFRFGIGSLDGLFARLSRRFRLTMRPVVLTDGAVAIDVDNARTLAVAETILAHRDEFGRAAA